MNKLHVPHPTSGGVILSYRCTSECRHCLYGCSPTWKDDWISENDLEGILLQLAPRIQPSPLGPHRIDINHGLHFSGGEPFLNFPLLLKASEMAQGLGVPSTFVETNCFWCAGEDVTLKKLRMLRESGLDGVLISVNPFTVEYIPFNRVQRAVRMSGEVFGENMLLYQESSYYLLEGLGITSRLPFEEYLSKAGVGSLNSLELIPMGRMPYRLCNLYEKRPAKHFFGSSCKGELTRPWHIHIDNHFNYMPGYCGGITLGDGRDIDSICQGIDLDNHLVLKALVTDIKNLYDLAVQDFHYREEVDGYISKCHLCVDLRKHLVQQTDEFPELSPRELYQHLK